MDIFSEISLTNKLNKAINKFDEEKFNSQMVQALISRASEIIPPAWPLKSFIAVNPLKGFETKSFLEAAKAAKWYFNAQSFLTKAQYLEYLDRDEISLSALNESLEMSVEDIDLNLVLLSKEINLKKLFREILFARDLEFKNFPNLVSYPYTKLIDSAKPFIKVNNYMIKFLKHFFDEGIAVWEMPEKEKGLYLAWKILAEYDSQLNLDKQLRSWLKQLPDCPERALIVLLDSLGVEKDSWEEYLKASLAALPGWAAFIKWRHLYAHAGEHKEYPVSKLEYLVIRLAVESIFLFQYFKNNTKPATTKSFNLPLEEHKEERYLLTDKKLKKLLSSIYEADFSMMDDAEIALVRAPLNLFLEREPLIWLNAWEDTVHKPLAEKLYLNYQENRKAEIKEMSPVVLNEKAIESKSLAQMIFCIDVRSESIRRSIERDSRIETFGFAGFFGLPVAYKEYGSLEFKDSCPVLIKPKHFIDEKIHHSCLHEAPRHNAFQALEQALFNIYKSLKLNISSAFVLAEASGPIYMLSMLFRTFIPELTFLFKSISRYLKPNLLLEPVVDKGKDSLIGFTKKEQILFAEMALRLMGLTKNFAPLVVFCGHGSTTENNHYASALECGACASNHGGNNAKALATILNRDDIREELSKRGIKIAAETKFIGAEHNTTTDDFQFYAHELETEIEKKNLETLQESLKLAQLENNRERSLTFKNFSISESEDIKLRSADWSEVRPEWGLAGNHSFIIAPRALSKGLDLSSSVFMHSYNYEEDESALLLETIMTAPMVVAQWINSQYYFSTVDNVNFGAGSKITHNIVGNIGVMQGNASDLFTGLSLQSLMQTDKELYHRPLRLRVFIFAPLERVEKIIKKNQILQNLFYKQWIKLIVLDPLTEELSGLVAENHWQSLRSGENIEV